MEKHTAYCVSLGPGDPDLLTLKALRVLKSSDRIFCPGTSGGSRAGDLLLVHGIPEDRIELFAVPMKEDRGEALETYLRVASDVVTLAKRGQKVSFVAEGDGGFYSSQHYIADFLQGTGEVEVYFVPGVPAFIAAGARAGLHVAKGDEGLLVLPLVQSPDEIEAALSRRRTVVLMKPSRSEEVIKTVLRGEKMREVHYLENVGVQGREFVSDDLPTILSRPFPYFSILILK